MAHDAKLCRSSYSYLRATAIVVNLTNVERFPMPSTFLLYGATSFVGGAIANLAVEQGVRPVIAERDAAKVASKAAELGVEFRAFRLETRLP